MTYDFAIRDTDEPESVSGTNLPSKLYINEQHTHVHDP